jgi:hypothetical protein
LVFLIIKEDAIYITSQNVPIISDCLFVDNKAFSSDFGNDIIYNSVSNSIYSPSDIINTCSFSSNPRIIGNIESVVVEMINCFLPNNIFSNICVLSPYCNMYVSRSSCRSATDLNTEDGPCVWILDEDGENGNCIPHSDFNCNNLKHCVHVNSEVGGNENCFWDITDSNGKCKTNSSTNPGTCSNSNHYEIINSNCTLKSCSSRIANDSDNPCGVDNCYKDPQNGNKCIEICSGESHYSPSSSKICVEKKMFRSSI